MDDDPCWPGPAKWLLEGPERGVVLVIALIDKSSNWDRSGNAPNRNGRPKRKADRC